MQMSGLGTNFLRNPPGMETSEQLIRTVIVLTKKNDAVQKANPVITTENRFGVFFNQLPGDIFIEDGNKKSPGSYK